MYNINNNEDDSSSNNNNNININNNNNNNNTVKSAYKEPTYRSRTTIVWPFFVYSKMAMFQAKK